MAIFSILALAGVVQFGLPLMCGASASICRGDESVAAGGLDEAQLALDAALGDVAETSSFVPKQDDVAVAALVTAPVPVASSAVAEVAVAATPAVLTYDNLIASTFAALDLGLTAAPAPLTPAGGSPAGETQPGELISRSVTTVAINDDGTPVTEASASSEPVAEAEMQVAEATPTPSPSPQGGGGQESSAPEAEARATSMAYAPASGDVASVTGSGANVRSLPQRGGSDVLFALRGGEEVTIVQMSKGWAKIVDKQGRSGWIYGQYLDRG